MRDTTEFFEGHDIPECIKKRAIAIMRRFNIWGLCDGMYIANILAYWNGSGDGQGVFEEPKPFTEICAERAANELRGSYGCNIEIYEKDAVKNIILTGDLDTAEAIQGLGIKRDEISKQLLDCEQWRVGYLTDNIKEIDLTLKELRETA